MDSISETMRIKLNLRFVSTVFLTSFLTNIFYFRYYESVQKLLVWSAVLLYLVVNLRLVNRMVNTYILKYLTKKNICVMLILWGMLIVITPLIHGTKDFSYVKEYFSVIASLLTMLVICVRIYKVEHGTNLAEKFMQYYIYGMVVYIISTVLAILFTQYREFIVRNVAMSSYSLRMIQDGRYLTRIGFAGLSVYASGIKCTIANLFVLYFTYKNLRENKKNTYGLVFLYVLTLLGEFFYSRTSLLVSVVLLLVFIFCVLTQLYHTNAFAKYVLIFAIVILSGTLLIGQYEGDNLVIKWAFEGFINLLKGNGFQAASLRIMRRMAFVPEPSTLIWGDGLYTDPGTGYYYKNVDLGYLRSILYYGLPGFSFVILLVIFTLRGITRIGNTKEYKLLSVMLFISCVAFEVKGEGMPIYYPIVFLLLVLVSKPDKAQVLTRRKRQRIWYGALEE